MGYHTEVAEGRQGATTYYTGAMEWGELVKQVVFPDQLEEELSAQGEGEDEQRMQRGLSPKRIPTLVDYLNEPDHFFSAVTLIALPPDLRHAAREAEPDEDGEEADYKFERAPKGTFGRQKRGTLYLSGSVRLFPADGQHRLKAAQEAMREGNKKLSKEEVPVVVVPYRGPDQVRQLFADLNLNAKPVSKTVGLDFDTRHPVVLLAKHIARSIPLFDGRVNRVSNSLSKTSRNVISMNTLYEATNNLLAAFVEEGTVRDAMADPEIEIALRHDVTAAWHSLVDAFDDHWTAVLANEDGAAGALREKYVFPHGLGWQALSLALGTMIKQHPTEWEDVYGQTVRAIDWSRDNPLWDGVAMTGDRVNNTGPGVKATAALIVEASEKISVSA